MSAMWIVTVGRSGGWLHPWFAQRWRTLGRGGAPRRPVLVTMAAMAIVLAVAAALDLPPTRIATALAGFALQWPAVALLSVALLTAASTGPRLARLSRELRTGWWAAMPIAPRCLPLALVATALARMAIGVAVWAGVVALATMDAQVGVAPAGSWWPVIAGLVLGTLLALGQGMRRPPLHDAVVRTGRREALFAWTPGNHRRLPHLADWQRRSALVRWRLGQGGHFWVVGALLLTLPDRVGVARAAGLLLMTVSWLWLATTLRACAAVAVQALHLLRATPATSRGWRDAALRYPLFAAACAAGLAVAGEALLGFTGRPLSIWLVALLLACLPAAWRLRTAMREAA
jgi:hypothetical protein